MKKKEGVVAGEASFAAANISYANHPLFTYLTRLLGLRIVTHLLAVWREDAPEG